MNRIFEPVRHVEVVDDGAVKLREEVNEHIHSACCVLWKRRFIEERGSLLNMAFYSHDASESWESWESSEKIVAEFCTTQFEKGFGEIQ